jgi:hypothetical protein
MINAQGIGKIYKLLVRELAQLGNRGAERSHFVSGEVFVRVVRIIELLVN